MNQPIDTVFRNGTAFVDGALVRADVGVLDGRIEAIDDLSGRPADTTIDATGLLVLPGLIDLHTHVYWAGGRLGVNPAKNAARTGVTTWVDAGSTGAGSFEGLLRHVVDHTAVRVVPFLNLSYIGLATAGMPVREVGELWEASFADLGGIVRAEAEFPGRIAGVKLRASANAIGDNAPIVLPLAREAADLLGVPLMVHVGMAPPTIDEVLPYLAAGDVITHCYHPHAGGSILGRGSLVKPSVLEARERGVRFDVGHGVASMSHAVARQAMEQGLVADTLSSDLHAENIDSVLQGLPTVMDKFLALGLTVEEVIDRVTARPAEVLGRPDLGRLRVGAIADLALFRLTGIDRQVQDSTGDRLHLTQTFSHQATYLAGTHLAPFDDGRVDARTTPWATRFGASFDED